MNEEELRRVAVRRRQAGETTEEIAAALGRTGRWVRPWVARHETAEAGQDHSNRILADAGLTRRRGRTPGYKSKGAPYPHPTTKGPGEYHQADLIGPRNLDSGIGFHAFNLIDVGTHAAGSEIIDILRPPTIAATLRYVTGVCRELGQRATLNLLVSDGRRLVGSRLSVESPHNSRYLRHDGELTWCDGAHIASEPLDERPWEPVSAEHLVEVTPGAARKIPVGAHGPA